jgi:hypothetical protein
MDVKIVDPIARDNAKAVDGFQIPRAFAFAVLLSRTG